MRKSRGPYECALCGALLDLPLDDGPRVEIHSASGERTMRVLTYRGKEIHRCAIEQPRSAAAPPGQPPD